VLAVSSLCCAPVGLLVAALRLAAPALPPPPARAITTPSLSPALIATVRHTIDDGWGHHSEYSATIFEDGTVRYVKGTEGAAPYSKTLSRKVLAQIVEAFEKANYFALKDSYWGRGDTGDVGPVPETIYTSYTRNGRTKKVTHDRATFVPGLSEMEVRIEEILGTQTWISAPK
jgi:hypothetical protein